MNFLKLSSVTLITLFSTSALAADPVIYGEDNRIETYQSRSPLHQELAAATAAQVPLDQIRIFGRNAALEGPSIAEGENVCSEVKFSHQSSVSKCSGVLVAPDLIVTAGHCVMSPSECRNYAWVFNYKVRNTRQKDVVVRERDVYRCKEILHFQMTRHWDFGIVRLEREVSNARPVKVATEKPKVGTAVMTIGNPTGLPQKIADGAVVKSVSEWEFKANLDTFNYGSGSPVFNQKTGEFVGVLVRGETDFVDHQTKSCLVPNVISDDSPGEDVSSTLQFLHLLEDLMK